MTSGAGSVFLAGLLVLSLYSSPSLSAGMQPASDENPAASYIAVCRGASPGAASVYFEPAKGPLSLMIMEVAALPECDSLPLPVSRERVRWMSLVSDRQLPRDAATVSLLGQFEAEVSVSEIAPLDQGVALVSRSYKPEAAKQIHELSRGAWFWSPDSWQLHSRRLWQAVESHDLTDLYLTIPVSGDRVEHPRILSRFLQAASARNVRIWAVVGDPADVFPAGQKALTRRARAYLDWNTNAPAKQQLTGIQLDIEPYLLPGFALNPEAFVDAYIETITEVRQAITREMPLDLVLPYWWGSHPGIAGGFFEALTAEELTAASMSLTVMNYTTDQERIRFGPLPFLAWGDAVGIPVRVALEMGALPDETLQVYRASQDAGELWLLTVGGQRIALLLKEALPNPAGAAWAFSHQLNVPGRRVTFDGDLQALETALQAALPAWQTWSSFGGVAIHGIDLHE